jgi:hypothetical protein
MMTLHEVSALGTLLRWVLRHPEGEAPAPARALRAAMFLAERAAKADPLFLSPQLIRCRWHRARPNPERPRCSWCGADGDRAGPQRLDLRRVHGRPWRDGPLRGCQRTQEGEP